MPPTGTFFNYPSVPSRLKHDILERYLRAAFTVITRGTGRELVYADLYAGAGKYEDGTPGSPLIAATIAKERAELGEMPRVVCFNVERGRVNFALLEQNLRAMPQGMVFNRSGDWRKHVGELKQLIEDRAAIIFMDPFKIGVALGEIMDLIEQIGPEPRDLILRLDLHGLKRAVGLKRKYDEDREAAAVSGGDIGMEVRAVFATADAALGGTWWQDHIKDGELKEDAVAPLVADFCERLETVGIGKGPRRRTAAVAVPFGLDGSTFYYLILVSRSTKAITLFSDAVEGAFSSAYREREGPPRPALAESLPLFEDMNPPPPLTGYFDRQARLLEAMRSEVAAFIARRPWGASFHEGHYEMVRRHMGLFSATQLRNVVRDLEADGTLAPIGSTLGDRTHLRAKAAIAAV